MGQGRRALATPGRVEVQHVGPVAGAERVVDVVEHPRQVGVRLVGQHDARGGPKRHRHHGVERSSFGARKERVLERRRLPEAGAEEIAERHGHGRRRCPVPEHLEPQRPQHRRRPIADGDPHPSDHARALDVGQREGLTRPDGLEGAPFRPAVLAPALARSARGVLRAGPPGSERLELVQLLRDHVASNRQHRSQQRSYSHRFPQSTLRTPLTCLRRTATDTPSCINPEAEQREERTKHQNDRSAGHWACRQCGLRRGGRPCRQRRKDPEAGPKTYPRMRPASPVAKQKHAKGERSPEQRSKHDDLD